MAPMSSNRRRPFNTRRKSARKSESNVSSVESPSITETRSMKRKYVPGGLGGGGSSAAAAAAAVVHGDGFKPREERGWEEFHQDLDIGAPFPVFSADEVDGIKKPTSASNFDNRNGSPSLGDAEGLANGDRHDRSSVTPGGADTTPRRRPGRPPRRTDSMLKGIGTPEVPKVVPLPGFNPREKLTLPKPSFRAMNPFHKYEQDSAEKINYVDKTMANVGYQESEIFIRPEKKLIRVTEGNIEEDLDMATGGKTEGDSNSAIGYFGVGRVEYDMDEQDSHWLETHNIQRKVEGVEPIKPAIFEITMTKIEKEWHALEKRIPKPNPKPPQTHRPRSSSAAAVNAHGGPASIDASVLKAYCDKHVPTEWRREHDVDTATSNAMRHYNRTRKEIEWGDSQQSAMMLGVSSQSHDVPVLEPVEAPTTKLTLTMGSNKRKRDEKPKIVWRLPSGAPVIPQAVYNSVESSLGRFTVRRRKEFAAEACKYWTLKREARRGAALLKRLQLQMETFTSMEITRRNFVGMGAAGGVRLQRRIDFAEQLLQDVDKLRQLSGMIKKRENEKLEDAKLLKDIVQTVYFPIAPILMPALDKAIKRYYTSVAGFSQDLGAVFAFALEADLSNETTGALVDGETLTRDAQSDLKFKKALAKRIVKAVKEPLEDAALKESQLRQKSYEKELRELDRLLENSVSSRRDSIDGTNTVTGENDISPQELSLGVINTNGFLSDGVAGRARQEGLGQDEDAFGDINIDPTVMQVPDSTSNKRTGSRQQPTPESMPSTNDINGSSHGAMTIRGGGGSRRADNSVHVSEPPTPPMSSGEASQPFSMGGIPWYMQPFDPSGTTIEEERWTGRDLVRGMSEDLSDMDEEELSGLVDADAPDSMTSEQQAAEAAEKKRIAYNAKRRKRKRGYR
ncbi:hypothetical protein P7C71_g52, partial [Lecanoromycetidae sp. Uapishka_2]